jgi:microcystin-dependent protein
MSNPYIGEIRMFGGSFAPAGWAFCDGQTMAISENDTLFSLIGTTYGGDGQSTFNLPDLRGRVPIHMGTKTGTTYTLAEKAGEESVTLTVQQIPAHTHPMPGSSSAATTADPTNNMLATAPLATTFPYGTDAPLTPLSPNAVTPAGGSQPHENLQPYTCINFIISLFGVYPSPT